MSPGGKTTYQGKDYIILGFDSALAKFRKQREEGLKPVMVKVNSGYIVAEATFKKEGE